MKKFILALTTLSWIGSGLAQIPTSGLISSWKFDGSITADSQGTNTLVSNGIPTLLNGYQGQQNTAAYFNSTGILGSNSTDFQAISFTFSAWVYVNAFNPYHTLANVRMNVSSAPYNSFNLCIGNSTSHRLTFFCTTTDVEDASLQDPGQLAYQVWQHVAVTVDYDGVNTNLKLFKNGTAVSSSSISGSIIYNGSDPFALGNVNGATDNTNGLDGLLDEVLFYNRALSELEICQMYAEYSATTCALTVNTPTNLDAVQGAGTEVNLSWNDNASNETGYLIEKSLNGGATWATLVNLPAGSTTYTDNATVLNQTYSYRVFAYNASDTSEASNIEQITLFDVGIESLDEMSFSIYPNPVNDVLNIDVPETSTAAILSLSGNLLQTVELDANLNTIHIGVLSSGIYFLKVGNSTVKFIKE